MAFAACLSPDPHSLLIVVESFGIVTDVAVQHTKIVQALGNIRMVLVKNLAANYHRLVHALQRLGLVPLGAFGLPQIGEAGGDVGMRRTVDLAS